MQLAMIGLGRMGANMVRRLTRGGQECVVFDTSTQAVNGLARASALGATSLVAALYERFTSRGGADFQNKLLSAMRWQFGAHVEKPAPG